MRLYTFILHPPSSDERFPCCTKEQPGVLGVDLLRTRVFGNKIYVDIETCAEGQITLAERHEIAEQVHNAIEAKFPKVKHIMVHVNPAQAVPM